MDSKSNKKGFSKLQRNQSNDSKLFINKRTQDQDCDDLKQQSVMSYQISQGDSLNASKVTNTNQQEEQKVIGSNSFRSPDEVQIHIEQSKYGGGKNRRNEFNLRKSIPYKSKTSQRPCKDSQRPIQILPQLSNPLNLKLNGSQSVSNNRKSQNKLLISTSSQQNTMAISNTDRQRNNKPPPRKIFKRSVINGKMLIDKSAIAKKIQNFKQLTNGLRVASNKSGMAKIKLNLLPNTQQSKHKATSQSFTHQNSNSLTSQQQIYRLNASIAQNSKAYPNHRFKGNDQEEQEEVLNPKADITTNSTNTGAFGSGNEDETGFFSPTVAIQNLNKNLLKKKSNNENISQSSSFNKYAQYYNHHPEQYKNSRNNNIFSSQNNSSFNLQSRYNNKIGGNTASIKNISDNNNLTVGGGGAGVHAGSGIQTIMTASNHKYTKPLQISRLGTKLFKNMIFNVIDYNNNTEQQQSKLFAVARKPLYNNTTLLDDVNQSDKISQIYGSKVLDALTLDFNPKSQTLFHGNGNTNHKLSDLVNNHHHHKQQKLNYFQLNYENDCNDFYHHQRQGGGAFDINMYQSGVCFLTGQQSIAHFGEYQIMMMNKNQKNPNSSCYSGRQHGRIIKLNSGLFITQSAIDINSQKNLTNATDMRSKGFLFGQQQHSNQLQYMLSQQQQQQQQQQQMQQFKFNSCRLSQKVLQNQASNGVNKSLNTATIKNSNSISNNKSGTQKSTTQKFSKLMKKASGSQQPQLINKRILGQNQVTQIGDRRTQKWN